MLWHATHSDGAHVLGRGVELSEKWRCTRLIKFMAFRALGILSLRF